MFLSKTLYPLFSTGSTQEDRKLSLHDRKIVDWDKEHQHKQINREIDTTIRKHFTFFHRDSFESERFVFLLHFSQGSSNE